MSAYLLQVQAEVALARGSRHLCRGACDHRRSDTSPRRPPATRALSPLPVSLSRQLACQTPGGAGVLVAGWVSARVSPMWSRAAAAGATALLQARPGSEVSPAAQERGNLAACGQLFSEL